MSETVKAEKVFAEISKADLRPEVRDVRGMVSGEAVRQGDVYLIKVSSKADMYAVLKSDFRQSEKGAVTQNMQLAPGTTKGSRHILASNPGLTVYAPAKNADPLEGPFIEATEDFELTHPEHANFLFGPGQYACIYQRDYAAEERRRVAD